MVSVVGNSAFIIEARLTANRRRVINLNSGPPFDSVVWFDISDLSTLFQDTAGTVPVTTVGDPVGRINDKSGNGKNATQAIAGKRPTLQVDIYGEYYLQFDGVDDVLSTGNIDFSTTNNVYIFTYVGKGVNAASAKVMVSHAKFFVADTNTGIRYSSSGTVAASNNYLPVVSAPFTRLLSANFSIPAPHVIVYENGSEILNHTDTQGTGNYTNAPIHLGASSGTSLFSDFRLYSLIIRKKESSLSEINSVTGYFNARRTAIEYQQLLPNDARLLVSDYTTISEQSSARLRLIRSITEANDYRHCSPGSRVGISTDALAVRFTVYYSALVSRNDVQNYKGIILVNGIYETTFNNSNPYPADPDTSTVTVEITRTTNTTRKYELVFPFGTAIDLLSVDVSVDATVIQQPVARPATKLQFLGDSITHGFSVTSINESWAYNIAITKNMQLINSGYGSLQAVASYGNDVAACDAIVVTLGVNNYLGQQALATFKAAYKSMLQNIRTTLPSAKIYAVTPFYISTTPLAIPLSDYRTQESDAVTEIADGNTTLIDGLTLMTNSSNRLVTDGVHLNDLGASEIATNLAALIT